MIDPREVLAQFDAARTDFAFPDLDHGYYYAIDCRMSAFSDAERWALIVETVGYNPRGFDVYDVLHHFGNCLTTGGPGFENEDFLGRIDNMDEIEAEDEPETFAGAKPIRVRGENLAVGAAAGTDLVDVFRSLVPPHRELFLATDAELRRRIPADIPRVLQLDEWHQPNLFEVPPSGSEVYIQLANVLSTGNAQQYQPTEAPNTHWSNWPESGSL